MNYTGKLQGVIKDLGAAKARPGWPIQTPDEVREFSDEMSGKTVRDLAVDELAALVAEVVTRAKRYGLTHAELVRVFAAAGEL